MAVKSKLPHLNESQTAVWSALAAIYPGWKRPGEIKPLYYTGGASSTGRILGSLQRLGLVEKRSADRGNGTTCREWRLAPMKDRKATV